MTERKAKEQWTIEAVIPELPKVTEHAGRKFRRLRRIADFPDDATVLDVGAAHGLFVAACNDLGYHAYGVEPWDEARANAQRLAEHLSSPIPLVEGVGEKIPFEDEFFDVVHSHSVIEHVADLDATFSECFRVLKPGGVFWFNTASSMCPIQDEIDGFPLFGWYPNALKLKIMNWATKKKPKLVGGTETPAIHWFTPWKARRLLLNHGFSKVYDRWQMRGEDEGGTLYKCLLKFARMNSLHKFTADVLVKGCSYAAIK